MALIALVTLTSTPKTAEARSQATSGTQILFQAFPWDAQVKGQKFVWYRHLMQVAPKLRRAGITHVWYPPVARSVSPQGYMPSDFYDLGEGEALDHNRTLYGNEKELKQSLVAFQRLGIVTIADAVLNHRCASQKENGIRNVFHAPSGKMWWEKWAITQGDYAGTGAPDTGGDFGAAPDLDHTNSKVREDIKEWLRWLKQEIGFQGVRFDFTKGYSPKYAQEYAAAMGAEFAVGEYWTSMGYDGSNLLPDQDGHRQQLTDWIDGTHGTVSSFDFTTKGLLQEAVKTGNYWRLQGKDGRASGLLGWWPGRSVTFVDNHDTGSLQNHWPFPADKVLEGYAYILTHPGVPTVFWDHFFAWGPEHQQVIQSLCLLRHEMGIQAESKLEIVEARQGLYAAKIGGKVALRLGHEHWSPGPDWQERLAGSGFMVWTYK
jgi:alpha-amylase